MMQRVADQVKSSFSDSLTELQKTGFSVNFFVLDVVLPIDAECSANHLPMIASSMFNVVGVRGWIPVHKLLSFRRPI